MEKSLSALCYILSRLLKHINVPNHLQRYVTKQMMYIDSHEAIHTYFFNRRYKIETKKNISLDGYS